MRRLTAFPLGIALVGVLAGTPATATSVEDEREEAILVAVAGDRPNGSLVAETASARPIAPLRGDGVVIDDLSALSPVPRDPALSGLFRDTILYDLDAPHDEGRARTAPLDGISGFAQTLVIGLDGVDLESVPPRQ